MGFNSQPEYLDKRHESAPDVDAAPESEEPSFDIYRGRGFEIEKGPNRRTPEVLPSKPELADERPVPPVDPADLIY